MCRDVLKTFVVRISLLNILGNYRQSSASPVFRIDRVRLCRSGTDTSSDVLPLGAREQRPLVIFRADLISFTRYYEFLSQIVDYDSTNLE
ncbi:hypothetical protein [Allorhodopirellula heiligendammensis]|uniref:Uncharacterized protein n=1 Tax=Allorhodopirellula heiligendammensis TaxID=2714739 RepID=A0A5C6C1Y4_9BACT|nr:hypothetical protein [Allorhodopirellula heiligendammensis]TWU18570.1 hypothetical protein Poly21_07340 [Allorhodopirellula heiligendammensis]